MLITVNFWKSMCEYAMDSRNRGYMNIIKTHGLSSNLSQLYVGTQPNVCCDIQIFS